ncbi:hypothetical protein HG536_0B01940 [Torulaspora globosa]|uniref:Uncharacterized protein n=1 Tax=Torulaspora globosa TaxID=48254 RepID=A0A7G3ZCU5_9SACH|nr:uncharacterized protein HG536_0B01940 [Torulaspora globosa]QLL31331.1 hypothetical protein HG536_0B01940 [Torulaspora globosa]
MSDQRPIRLAVLGGELTGKTSFTSGLTVNIVHEVHYPTRQQSNWLFDYLPRTASAKALLDGQAHERILLRTQGSQTPEPLFSSPCLSPHLMLSPLLYQAFLDDYARVKDQHRNRSANHIKHVELKRQDNPFYKYLPSQESDLEEARPLNTATNSDINILRSAELGSTSKPNSLDVALKLPDNYIPPEYTPIAIDIIDTPGFNPDMVVPFLEVSLFSRLDKRVLRGLAEEPRMPVSTTSMLVASGASELNAKIDGYLFVYSAVPELSNDISPPDYGDTKKSDSEDEIQTTVSGDFWSANSKRTDGGFSLLEVMRNCILEAWTEFGDYKKRREDDKEGDVYSLAYAFKSVWKTEKQRRAKLAELRNPNSKLKSLDLDPSSPHSPPPCLILCTHAHDPMSSPRLIELGQALAAEWRCGFAAVDSMDDYNVDVAMSLIIREVVEKNKLLGKGRSKSFSGGASTLKKLMRP